MRASPTCNTASPAATILACLAFPDADTTSALSLRPTVSPAEVRVREGEGGAGDVRATTSRNGTSKRA
ncbi:hypothetical protein CSOJ01_14061 [Colletotrichum sojae]|uniref:Uncharacterized protein n=1 Tax=Colletotrichum sojae TaxID=2175907 RepID=A0A8H6IRJ8_9PEZI|nr:hypothetical protein CSOJ01_14061 [Colletotrichum sojae]